MTDIVAIDGPAGAGKSSVARRVAEQLGFAFLDTGAMYRAATWRAMEAGVDLDDGEGIAASTKAMDLDMHDDGATGRVLVDGHDVTEAIRTPEVTRRIAKLDQIPAVRAHLVALQRQVAAAGPTVAEGRDMGTVVFPRAKCKIFLEASLDERARRRARQLEEKGNAVDFDRLRADIHRRDEENRNRAASPLRCADDAVRVDTTSLTFEDVVERIVQLARAAL